MPNPAISYYSALIGAFAAIITGFLLESYKRHKDKQGIASALLGEIRSIHKAHCGSRQVIRQLNAFVSINAHINFRSIRSKPPSADIVYNKCADKIGLLPDPIPEYVVTFYNVQTTIYTHAVDLFSGNYDDDEKERKNTMKSLTNYVDEAIDVGNKTIPHLEYIAKTSWFVAMIGWKRPKIQTIGG